MFCFVFHIFVSIIHYSCHITEAEGEVGLFILFTASAFRKLSSIYVFSYFPFGFEGRIWDLIVSVPDHCLSFYFVFMTVKVKVSLFTSNVGSQRKPEDLFPADPTAGAFISLGNSQSGLVLLEMLSPRTECQ